MKQITLLILLTLLLVFCGSRDNASQTSKAHPKWAENAVIYEFNTRQFTPEGTFRAAATHLPRLQELGVDVLWMMPVQPIGVKQRKGSLGSYYAISDYTSVNPEFGTREDMVQFISTAHDLGLKVILDWVANHTAPDHAWVENTGWHLRDSVGNLVVRYDWTDIAELNYDNPQMRRAMKDAMLWWVDSMGVDGFRCDVAMEVPTEFWNETIVELQKHRPDIFMLCEAEQTDLTEKTFDMYYGWDLHHIMNAIAKQKTDVDSLRRYLAKADTLFPAEAIRMNFTSNHDENSWNGTEFERMGPGAVKTMAALTYLLPGMPLIYSGQETGLDHRLRFFDKDTIQWQKNSPYQTLYKALNNLRKTNDALKSQPNGGKIVYLQNNNPKNILSFSRAVYDNQVVALFNLSDQQQNVNLLEDNLKGQWKKFPSGETFSPTSLNDFKMEPWQYIIIYRH